MIGRFRGDDKCRITSRVKDNLSWLTPEMPNNEHSKMVRKSLEQSGRCYFETMIADRLLAESQVDTDLPEQVRLNFSAGKPLIFVTVHIANLGDLMSATLSNLLFRDYHYLYGASPTRPIANKLLQGLTTHIRSMYLRGTPGHSSSPDIRTARDYVRALQKPNSFVIFHLDEAYDCQVHFPTFGRHINTRGNLIKAIKLAAVTGALIQPVFMTRLSNEPRFKMSWLPAFHVGSDGATLSKSNLMQHAQQLNDLFEPRVIENLADWAQICYLRAPHNQS